MILLKTSRYYYYKAIQSPPNPLTEHDGKTTPHDGVGNGNEKGAEFTENPKHQHHHGSHLHHSSTGHLVVGWGGGMLS